MGNKKKYLTYADIKPELKKYLPILENMYLKLYEDHVKNLRPAQVEGLWAHHTKRGGLLEHSLELADIAYKALEVNDYNLYRFFTVIALAHDYGKLFGKDKEDHAKWSLEYFEIHFIPKFEKYLKEEYGENSDIVKLWKEFLNGSELITIIKLCTRWHHINFEEKLKPFDKDAFVQRGGELFDTKYFPWVLLFLSTDFASIAKDWIING